MADEGIESVAAESTPSATPETSSPPSQPSPSPSSEPTTASPQGDQSKEGLLDAVLKVVPATNEKDVLTPDDPSAPQDSKPDDSVQAETPEEAEDDGSPDDETAPQDAAPVIKKKINKLLKQRRELRNEVAALRPVANIGSELEQFAIQNKLSGDDVAGVLQMAAMLRAGDYASFYRAVAPFVRTAQEYLGVVLPKDLTERVRAGQMTETAAREFARQRYDHQRSQSDLRETQQETQVSQVRAVQADVQRAVSSFELRLSANDPDYKAKAPSVRRAAQAMLFERGGKISNVQEALEITNAAYQEVNRQMRSIAPRPGATPRQPNGATQTSSARAAPKSLMEAAIQGLENARRAGG
jgi:hypothetical protein